MEINYNERMINYYPQVIQAIADFQAIVSAEAPEIKDAADEIWKSVDEAYFYDMSEARLIQWENVLDIVPLADSTISDRKDTVIARIRGQGKLNTEMINRIVGTFTGGTAKSWVANSTLYVEITPPPDNKQYRFENVEQELSRKVPAHLGFAVKRNYFTWGEVKITHSNWQEVLTKKGTWENVLLFVPFNAEVYRN